MESAEVYQNGRTYAEHSAWLDSLRGDEYRIVHMPIGCLLDLAMASEIKWILATGKADTETAFRCLKMLSEIAEGIITAQAISAVQPICSRGRAIMKQIHALPVEKQCRAFGDGDVFRILAKLNPSLLTALQVCTWHSAVPE